MANLARPILAEIHLEDDPLYQHTSSDKIHWLNEQSEPMTIENWADDSRHFIALTLTPADLSSRFWLVFYSDDSPLDIPLPTESDTIETLYQTPGLSITDNTLHCAYRGVFVGKF